MVCSTCGVRRRLLGRDSGGHALPLKILARGSAVAKITERIVCTAGGIGITIHTNSQTATENFESPLVSFTRDRTVDNFVNSTRTAVANSNFFCHNNSRDKST